MTIANVTTPLIGVVGTAVIGRLGEAHLLGAVAMSAVVFDCLFWLFAFLRMGTVALTAQALGAGDVAEERATLFRALMVAAVSMLQVRIGLEPLHELQRDIAGVRRGDKERLTGEYPAELQPVAHELNALVDHNREVVERARRHVGNLAHALKTPIAVLKNAAGDGGQNGVMKQSIDEMEGFVERQLRRARVAARAEARAG